MPRLEPLGLLRLEALHAYVHDLERSRRFYTQKLDFAEVGLSSPQLERAGRQRSALFEAGGVRVICSAPAGEGGRAWRWLRKHPDGVGALVFAVEDARRTFALLEERGGTPVTDLETVEDEGGGRLHTFNITTPFGDTTFRFVQREGFRAFFPGLVAHEAPRGGRNALGLRAIDHVSAAFETMRPTMLWLEHVLGFEPAPAATGPRAAAAGLRSAVMTDPASGITITTHEPARPAFKRSLVNVFHEEQRGDGIRHAALAVDDLLAAVRGLGARGVELVRATAAYHDALAARLEALGVGRIDEDPAALRELGVFVEGSGPGRYLLQAFLKDSAATHREPEAGPFFFELLERKGERGFCGGQVLDPGG